MEVTSSVEGDRAESRIRHPFDLSVSEYGPDVCCSSAFH